MRSAYAGASATGAEEPPYTTWKIREDGEHVQTLDYIFHTEECGVGGAHAASAAPTGLRVDRVLGFPSGEELGPGRLPCEAFASDHLSLIADFSFVASAQQGSAEQ